MTFRPYTHKVFRATDGEARDASADSFQRAAAGSSRELERLIRCSPRPLGAQG